MNAALPPLSAWEEAGLAAALFAISPWSSGVRLRAAPGPVRDAWLAGLRALLPADWPFVRMPASIGDDRLLGALDLVATLRAGKPIFQSGLLAAAHGGVLIAAMAERLEPLIAARLVAALDQGLCATAREGPGAPWPARIGIVALDEGLGEDERPPAALLDRLAFDLDLDGVGYRQTEDFLFAPEDIASARRRYAAIGAGSEAVRMLTTVAAQLGIASLRAPVLALRAARAAAALRESDEIEEEDLALAARLVLAPRATALPPAPPKSEPNAEPADDGDPAEDGHADAGQSAADPERPDEGSREISPEDVQDIILAAAVAAIPPGLLSRLQDGRSARSQARRAGKAGAEIRGAQRGRPLGARKGVLRQGRLSLVETLRAAVPWQAIRRQGAARAADRRLIVEPDDFRIVQIRARTESVAIFIVDASGSSAMQRLAEVKGAIELLLADCYVRREAVALIAFRGRKAEIVLPPTRSLARARRTLAAMAGGGGTPLAHALEAGWALADQLRRRGQSPLLVLMTDGRANVARDGSPGRPQALADALTVARRVRESAFAGLVIDTSPAFQSGADAPAERVSAAMGVRYIRLPQASAARVSQAVRAAGGH